jgi:hypothetical protein
MFGTSVSDEGNVRGKSIEYWRWPLCKYAFSVAIVLHRKHYCCRWSVLPMSRAASRSTIRAAPENAGRRPNGLHDRRRRLAVGRTADRWATRMPATGAPSRDDCPTYRSTGRQLNWRSSMVQCRRTPVAVQMPFVGTVRSGCRPPHRKRRGPTWRLYDRGSG